ncbi:hypothetical protein EJB05_46065, partial [Eragrostis curvula]
GEASTGQAKEEEEEEEEEEEKEDVQGMKIMPHCIACHKKTIGKICGRCATLIKENLLDKARGAMLQPGKHNLVYCLICHKLKSEHEVHKPNCIPITSYDGDIVAWASGNENWSPIFSGIQSDRCWRPSIGRPFLLHKTEGIRCTMCFDLLTTDRLYGCFLSFCCVKCWARGTGTIDADHWVQQLLGIDFEDGTDGFCLSCRVGFHHQVDSGHEDHPYILIIPDGFGRRPRVQLPPDNELIHMWGGIKNQEDPAGESIEILIKDDSSLRCRKCRMRLLDGGGDSCSFECALSTPELRPRPLLIKQCVH